MDGFELTKDTNICKKCNKCTQRYKQNKKKTEEVN